MWMGHARSGARPGVAPAPEQQGGSVVETISADDAAWIAAQITRHQRA
jgi:hypothetical protein